ncbi:hypothetical protein NQ315_001403 [Exocentrus adspersus]|uniref:Uncharacterized protein n=1 Tax=Exocentrus adspersus TaxID=1586481 RepID=A0AAV8WF57_9CUCU|nr:hypothetical protein NQ315_001403 [Exocentrus adspersus]
MWKLMVLTAVVAVALGESSSGESKIPQTVHQEMEFSPQGPFHYAFETENGIDVEASGVIGQASGTDPPPVVFEGQYSYKDSEGKQVLVKYVANENGFQPQSDILPTPPPVPEEIVKGLEYIQTHPEKPAQ